MQSNGQSNKHTMNMKICLSLALALTIAAATKPPIDQKYEDQTAAEIASTIKTAAASILNSTNWTTNVRYGAV